MVVTSVGVIVGEESQSSSTLALDTPAMAFEHMLASLARLEARLDASERRAAVAQPPPRPDPDPPYVDWQRGEREFWAERDNRSTTAVAGTDPPDPDWQRGRKISGRQSAIVMSVTAVSSVPQLGFGGGPSSHGQQHAALLGASPWDRYGVNIEQSLGRQAKAWDNPAHRLDIRPGRHAAEWDRYGADNDRFRGRRATAWDNPAHRMDEPESPYEEWQRGRGDTGRHRPIISPATFVDSHQHLGIVGSYARNAIQQPCDRYGADVEGFSGRRFTAWDNPTHRENDAGIHTVDSDYSNPSKLKDTSDSKVIATLGPQISEVNVSSGFPKTGDNIQVVISSLGKPCCEGIVSRGPHTKCAVLNSCTDPDSLQLHKGERIDTIHGKKDEISPIVSPLKDDFHITGDDDMAKAITKVLEKNFEIDEDMHSQALLFKNLWLEAEAKLCSISYEARFERMRIQMEDIKLKAPKEDEDRNFFDLLNLTSLEMTKAEDFKLLKIQTCVLRVNIHCEGCEQQVKKILQRIEGFCSFSHYHFFLDCTNFSPKWANPVLMYVVVWQLVT
ncbi:hypothetical protein SASPL_125671 [Salvia splendens]|uniref:HMA domain-containing protein n=1 Tax=Salvia splendens TaxID=180675 RepID=A0A8X8ZQE1_SALSN|nr:hypothetical protein SASPL_125671 [Salvia splendens]